MKTLIPQLYYLLRERPNRVNIFNLLRFIALLAGMVTLYSVLFHFIMAYEGHTEHSWVTGFYWTLTVMSTLGFGDITFDSDLGRIFSSIVLLSGIIFLLVLLPFTFIEFFYAPWLKAQAAARAPSELPPTTRGHIILTTLDAVTEALIERLRQYNYTYAIIVADLTEALRLHDLGYKVMLGDLDRPDTYRLAHADQARMVVTTLNDRVNTNVAFTVREISEKVPIIATANAHASVDILQLAGCSHVLELGELMGQAFARRVLGGDTLAHVIGQFEELVIAEATVGQIPLVGKTLLESRLREEAGVSVLGVWQRGKFELAHPTTRICRGTVLVLAGSEEAIQRYNDHYCDGIASNGPVIIIGGGRVGRATARALLERGIDYRIVELQPERTRDPDRYIIGDAAELEVLERAGIRETPAVVVTTHDDDTNIYLTIYCRRLRPDVQILSRSRLERNVATLHRAGADVILSYAGMGSGTILSMLDRADILMVAEGLDVFRVQVPSSLVGRSIADAAIRRKLGCTVVALRIDGKMVINPNPTLPLPAGAEMIIIGAAEAEQHFLDRYGREIGASSASSASAA